MPLIKRLAAAIGLALLFWGTSCAHRRQRTHDIQRTEETAARWDKRAEHAEKTKQHDEQKKTESSATYRRKTTPSPAGPIVEEEFAVSLSELQASSGVVHQRSGSELVTGEVDKKLKERDRGEVQTDTKAGWWSPWWLLLLIPIGLVALFVLRRFPSLSVPGIARALASRFVRARR